MRIIGGNDYYDSARAYGTDEKVVFVRNKLSTFEPIEIKIPWNSDYAGNKHYSMDHIGISFFWYLRNKNGAEIFAMPICVWFCGKKYSGVKLKIDSKLLYFWTYNTFSNYVKEHDVHYGQASYSYSNGDRIAKELENYFKIGAASKDQFDIFIENKYVILIYAPSFDVYGRLHHSGKWYVNTDGLKDIEFQKVIDPFSAFQELSMFVGGVLPQPVNPMVQIVDEKINLQKHSMDKWSFRKIGPNSKV